MQLNSDKHIMLQTLALIFTETYVGTLVVFGATIIKLDFHVKNG